VLKLVMVSMAQQRQTCPPTTTSTEAAEDELKDADPDVPEPPKVRRL